MTRRDRSWDHIEPLEWLHMGHLFPEPVNTRVFTLPPEPVAFRRFPEYEWTGTHIRHVPDHTRYNPGNHDPGDEHG